MTPRIPDVQVRVGDGLRAVATRLAKEAEIPLPTIDGKLYRPVIAWAAGSRDREGVGDGDGGVAGPPEAFWPGALALQMVHEASLLHDDILDASAQRRGGPSMAASRGVAVALVEGDHLLTAAYRVASATDSLPFLKAFARAVERTVAGEKRQCAARGRWLSEAEYREIVSDKSGELFGCAALLPEAVRPGGPRPELMEELRTLGIRTGHLYQMVDDFLDLCPAAELGKPPFQDLEQGKWTWPLGEAGLDGFPQGDPAELARSFLVPDASGTSVLRRAFRRLEKEEAALVRSWDQVEGPDGVAAGLIRSWVQRTRSVLEAEEAALGDDGPAHRSGATGSTKAGVGAPAVTGAGRGAAEEAVLRTARALGGPGDWLPYFARHSRSFRFSSRLFPREEGRVVAGVYAFCRFTDDLVDDAPPGTEPEELRARLDAWSRLVRAAWEGEDTGIPLLAEVMGGTARAGVDPSHAEELIRGVAMDLEPVRYETMADLRRYSYRVASVVGLWLTEWFGTRTPRVLHRAEAMGHAMQLTNILRDVGEDWQRGRLYLPLEQMAAFDVTPEDIDAAVNGSGPLPERWTELMEELMGAADRDYALAFEAIPALPRFYQRPVAVAGRVYQGIHQEIRRNDYDNLRARAYTSLSRKVVLGGGALWALRRERRQFDGSGALASV
ncbi:MAG: hypothetical protein EA352_07355 [Gemmatimonadales bacterium]|nr:MAG: hypothetical protein EA352_07355 [Gemmatimonadales bacterium]